MPAPRSISTDQPALVHRCTVGGDAATRRSLGRISLTIPNCKAVGGCQAGGSGARGGTLGDGVGAIGGRVDLVRTQDGRVARVVDRDRHVHAELAWDGGAPD